MIEGVSVIVLTRDRPDLFVRCAESIVPGDVPIVDRIVVQNGTDAETAVYAKAHGWMIVGGERNLSFAQGNNQAAAHAQGSHLFLLNNDASCEPETLTRLWAARQHPILGCLILDQAGSVNHAGMGFTDRGLPYHLGRNGDPSVYLGMPDVPCPAVTFAGVLIASAAYKAIGGMDERYWYSWEDVDFCLRAVELGIVPRVVLGARLHHAEFGTRTGSEDTMNFRQFVDSWGGGRLERVLKKSLGLKQPHSGA